MTKPHIAGTGKAEGERIFRLHDMLVQEVSLVDRAANLKQFLVLKREDASMKPGKELTPDGSGGFVTEKSEGAQPEVTTEAQKLELGPIATQTKADVLRLVSGTLENLMVVANAIKEADEAEGADMLPAPIVEGLKSISGVVQGVIERYSAPPVEAAKSEGAEEVTTKSDEVAPAAAPAEGPESVTATPATEDEVLKALAAAAKVLSPAAPVDKVGRKMSKTRLDKLREAVDALSELLADVGPEALEKRAAGAPASTVDPDPRAQEITELTKSVEELTKVAKSSRAEITKLQKSVGLPNSLPVEGGGVTSAPSSGGGDVSWPLDMNAPVSRDTVGKSQWFTSTENN